MADNKKTPNATPAFFVDKITDIQPDHLKNMGVEVVCIDLDNTTVYDSSLKSIDGVKDWIKRMRAAGLRVIILTNTFKLRAKFFARKFGKLEYIALANKPSLKGFKKVQQLTALPPSKIAMIGDQLFTDIEGANNAGMISIKVRLKQEEVFRFAHWQRVRKKERKYLRKKGFGSRL